MVDNGARVPPQLRLCGSQSPVPSLIIQKAIALAAAVALFLGSCSEPPNATKRAPAAEPATIAAQDQKTKATAAQPRAKAKTATLIKNVRVFDGTSDALTSPMNVLVTGNKIETISASAITPNA